MKTNNTLNYFRPIALKEPVEEVIRQNRDLINSEILKPGHRLPSEEKVKRNIKSQYDIFGKLSRDLKRMGFSRWIYFLSSTNFNMIFPQGISSLCYKNCRIRVYSDD